MITPEILIALMAAGAVLLITYGIAARPTEDAVQARLSQLVVQPRSLEQLELEQPFYERVMRPLIQRMARVGRRQQEGGVIAGIDAKLEKAGYPGGLRGADWVGVKLLSLIGFAILGFVLGLLLTGIFVWPCCSCWSAGRSATSRRSSGSVEECGLAAPR